MKIWSRQKQNPLIIMGNFNAKSEGREENLVGPLGLGIRNIPGEKLAK